jgi:SPP1 gp7 family putative phage head morphogenesis protein
MPEYAGIFIDSQKAMLAIENRQAAKLILLYRKSLMHVKGILADYFNRYGDDQGKWSYSVMQAYGRDVALQRQIQEELKELEEIARAQATKDITALIIETKARTTFLLNYITPASMNFAYRLIPKKALDALIETPWSGLKFSQRWGKITNDMAYRLQTELTQSMIQGETLYDATKRLGNIFEAVGERRAEMIVRTESNRYANFGASLAYRENADLVTEKERCAALDGRTCEECAARDGERVPVDDPRDISLHPNDRCVWVPVVKGIDENAPRWTSLETPGRGTYEEWIGSLPEAARNQVADAYKHTYGRQPKWRNK